jgi:Domain of unknown function (DUF4340)
MHTKGTIGLMAVAAIAAILAAEVSISGGAAAVDPRVGKPVLPQVAAKLADVGKVVLKRSAGTTTFVRQGNAWVVAEKGNYPADATKIRKVLLGLAQIAYVEPKTAEPSLYKRLNLEDPATEKSQSALVEIYDAQGGALGAVIAGRRRIDELGGGNDGVYVRPPTEARAWLARGTLDLDSDLVQWLDRRIVDIGEQRIATAVLQQPDGAKVTIARGKVEDKFALKEILPNRKLKSDTGLVEPATALQGFDLTDVKSAKDLAFPKDGVNTATYTTFDGLTVAVELTKQGEADWVRLSATPGTDDTTKAEAESLNQRWSPWVYGIAAYKAGALRTKLDDLLEPPPAATEAPAAPTGAAPVGGQSLPKKK